nr:DsbA family protein [uncultured Methanobrevibacter sp.]
MKITYWSDFACPYCYIGNTRLKRALNFHQLLRSWGFSIF